MRLYHTADYAPFIFGALAAAEAPRTEKFHVHRIVATLVDRLGADGFHALTWSDLVAIVREAAGLDFRNVRAIDGRAYSLGLAGLSGMPRMTGSALEAIADDTLGDLLARSLTTAADAAVA